MRLYLAFLRLPISSMDLYVVKQKMVTSMERFQTYISWKNYISHLLKCEECWKKHKEILTHIEGKNKNGDYKTV